VTARRGGLPVLGQGPVMAPGAGRRAAQKQPQEEAAVPGKVVHLQQVGIPARLAAAAAWGRRVYKRSAPQPRPRSRPAAVI